MYKYQPEWRLTDYGMLLFSRLRERQVIVIQLVQGCRTNAEVIAPQYWSKRETKVGSSLLSFTAHCTNGLFVQFTSLGSSNKHQIDDKSEHSTSLLKVAGYPPFKYSLTFIIEPRKEASPRNDNGSSTFS